MSVRLGRGGNAAFDRAPERSYLEPTSVEEALVLLGRGPDSTDIVAGGTDVVVAARIGKRPLRRQVMAIHRLAELQGCTRDPDGSIRVGAVTTHTQLIRENDIQARWSALSDAAALVGSRATQSVGTIGGNISNASPAMDTGSPLLCFDAHVELSSIHGVRVLPLHEFLEGPGATSRAEEELVTAIHLPALPGKRVGSAYLRHDYRAAMEIAVVGAGAVVVLDDLDRVSDARLALTSVAPTCIRAPEAEQLLRGCRLDELPVDAVCAAAQRAARPIGDVRATAEYRTAMVAVIVRRAIERAVSRATRRPSARADGPA